MDSGLGYVPNRHTIPFQDSTAEMIMMGGYYRMNSNGNNNINSASSMVFSGNSGMVPIGNSCTSSVSDSVPGLKHDAGLAVEWSVDEQMKLEEGISKYADEPNIMKCIKIAATLREKTVRDVALRCRWMTSKQKKHEALKLSRKLKDKKVWLCYRVEVRGGKWAGRLKVKTGRFGKIQVRLFHDTFVQKCGFYKISVEYDSQNLCYYQ